MHFVDGVPIPNSAKGYSGHGISSIITPFTNYLTNVYSMPFFQQEAIKIFIKGEFTFNGEDQPQVREQVAILKKKLYSKN